MTLYEASPYPVGAASIREQALGEVRDAELGAMSTLYVPPASLTPVDSAVRARLQAANVEPPSQTL